MQCADAKFALADLNRGERIVAQRSIPPVRLQRPRTHKNTPLDDHRPDARESMIRAGSCADAQYLARVDRGDNGVRQTARTM